MFRTDTLEVFLTRNLQVKGAQQFHSGGTDLVRRPLHGLDAGLVYDQKWRKVIHDRRFINKSLLIILQSTDPRGSITQASWIKLPGFYRPNRGRYLADKRGNHAGRPYLLAS